MSTLPDFFLADLPSDAALSPSLIRDACRTLRRNRELFLASRSTESLIGLIADTAGRWLDEGFNFRRLALEAGVSTSGFPSATLAAGMDDFFRELTRDNLRALVAQDLGQGQRLDQPAANPVDERSGRASMAHGPELLVHVTAGNLPVPALFSMVLGLLARSAQFIKCARGCSFLPRLFAHSIHDADPKLASCIELAAWRGGDSGLEAALFEHADCLTATGSDETLDDLRRRLPGNVRFIGHGHRVSLGCVTREVLSKPGVTKLAARAAWDVAAWNQQGCLSPHVIYAETGGITSPRDFAALLAGELDRLEGTHPRGPLPREEAATIAQRRALYEVRAAHDGGTRLWTSRESTAWTVVYESDPAFQFSCLNRFVYVKPLDDAKHLARAIEALRGKVSSMGLAAPDNRALDLVREFGRWGVTRVCCLGSMQRPPLTWRHDGRPALGDLVTWTDWER